MYIHIYIYIYICIHMTDTEMMTLLGRDDRNLKDAAHIVLLLLCNQQRQVNNMYLNIKTLRSRSSPFILRHVQKKFRFIFDSSS